jgi:hypothetical protein
MRANIFATESQQEAGNCLSPQSQHFLREQMPDFLQDLWNHPCKYTSTHSESSLSEHSLTHQMNFKNASVQISVNVQNLPNEKNQHTGNLCNYLQRMILTYNLIRSREQQRHTNKPLNSGVENELAL